MTDTENYKFQIAVQILFEIPELKRLLDVNEKHCVEQLKMEQINKMVDIYNKILLISEAIKYKNKKS